MISDLATALNTTPSNIEKIAKLLEEEKLVTIKYKMMKPYLVYGFKEKKKKGEKGKSLFVWKKKEGKVPEIKKQGVPVIKKKSLFMWKGKPFSFSNLFKKKEKPILKPLPKKKPSLPSLPKEKKSFFSKLFKKKEKTAPFPKLIKKEQPEKKLLQKPLPKEKKPFFSKLFKKKSISKFPEKKKLPLSSLTKKKEKPFLKPKKSFFSKLFKKEKEKEEFGDIKDIIKKSKGIRLEKKPIKPVFSPPKFQKPLRLKKQEKKEINTEEDAKKEIDNLINEIKKEKDKNLIKRNYKKALALYTKIKNTDDKMEYNKKIKDLYDKLTK